MARTTKTGLATTLALGALLLGPGSAKAGPPLATTSVGWATVGEALALGEPAADTAIAEFGAPLSFSGFSDRIFYADLDAALLAAGVSSAELEAADFIAFDLNGTTGGLEGGRWTFDDGQGGVLATMHTFGGIGQGILFNGDLVPSDYEALFTALPVTAPFVGLILFDLSAEGVNPFAPGLSATLDAVDSPRSPVSIVSFASAAAPGTRMGGTMLSPAPV